MWFGREFGLYKVDKQYSLQVKNIQKERMQNFNLCKKNRMLLEIIYND